ncbi:hypothetical protein [Brevibacillus sp. NRS-1366]|uniref:hypothetical protein n=1 Tax=Brevibacillus sp. NRS-1366 TaxID=3233899 RepID=UPI003D254D64
MFFYAKGSRKIFLGSPIEAATLDAVSLLERSLYLSDHLKEVADKWRRLTFRVLVSDLQSDAVLSALFQPTNRYASVFQL